MASGAEASGSSMSDKTLQEVTPEATSKDEYPPEAEGFNWLKRGYRGPNYISYAQFLHRPACSFDWGEDGYAGCSNQGGELLYLAAPSRNHGMIMVRGHFATSLYASLSRAQIEFGGPATFGLEVSRSRHAYDPEGPDIVVNESNVGYQSDELMASNGSTFRLGAMLDRGFFNHRWPLTEYYLDLHPNYQKNERREEKATKQKQKPQQGAQVKQDGGSEDEDVDDAEQEIHVGVCQMFSCVQGRVFYQVLRVEEDGQYELPHRNESKVNITMCGPVWFQFFNEGDHGPTEDGRMLTAKRPTFQHNPRSKTALVGAQAGAQGKPEIKFLARPEKPDAVEDVSPEDKNGSIFTIRFWDKERKVGLEAKLHQIQPDGTTTPLPVVKSKASEDSGTSDVQAQTKLTAYNTACDLQPADPTHPGKDGPMCATILATIRMIEGEDKDKDGGGEWPAPPTSRDLFTHVGASPSSMAGTGSLWESIFLQRQMKSEAVLDLPEFGMVGRCMEKILQVDIVPAAFDDKQQPNSKQPLPAALVSNLFVRENIDLKSLFWKIRFLVRVYKFLASPNLNKELSGNLEVPEGIVEFQMKRIREKIQSVVAYLVKALLEPPTFALQRNQQLQPQLATRMMPDHHVAGESNYFYVLTTLWYIVKNFKETELGRDWNWDWVSDTKGWGLSGHLFGPGRLPPEGWTFSPADRDKAQLLLWFHHASLSKLHEAGVLPESWLGLNHTAKVDRLEMAAKVVSAAKLSSGKAYVAEDEIFDRLSLISDELEFESAYGGGKQKLQAPHPGTIAGFTLKRVKSREYTQGLNPGWLPETEYGSTSGPWEIHALCHHSRLAVLTMEDDNDETWRTRMHAIEEAEAYKRNIRNFLNAEGTLVPCWERAHAKARRGWLRSEATSVLASTFISLQEKALSSASRSNNGGTKGLADDGSADQPHQGRESPAPPVSGEQPNSTERALARVERASKEHAKQARADESKLFLEILHMEGVMKDQLDAFEKFTGQVGRPSPVNWMAFSPPRMYHPTSFFDSLEDTPELYRPPQIGKAPIPASLSGAIRLPAKMIEDKMLFTRETINRLLPLECLIVSDLRARGQDEDAEGFTWETRTLEYDSEKPESPQSATKHLSWALYDSLVDQEVQHRFLTVRRGLNVPLASSPAPTKLESNANPAQGAPDPKVGSSAATATATSAASQALPETTAASSSPAAATKSAGLPEDPTAPAPAPNKLASPAPSSAGPPAGTSTASIDVSTPAAITKSPANTGKQAISSATGSQTAPGSAAAADTKPKANSIIPKEVLELLVYVLHSECAAYVGNHVLKFSRFSCQRRDSWVAGITLRSWQVGSKENLEARRLRDKEEAKKDRKRWKSISAGRRNEVVHEDAAEPEVYSDDHPIRLPLDLRDVWGKIKHKDIHDDLIIELQISSIVISTNAFGDFSKCTIVSELLSPKQVGCIVKDARKLWQKFIHQPQTARCLVFFLVLGELCLEITQHYKHAINTLGLVLKLDAGFSKTEGKLVSEQKNHPLEYELGVWSLEALYKLQNSLSATLRSLHQAKDELMEQIREGPGNRNIALERMCQEEVGNFENKLVQLTAINVRLERRIELNTRNKDATSAILAMRDSRTSVRQAELSLSQNATVQRLTYLTIAYLPVALMASIFAIPSEQHVLYPSMGGSWFVGAIAILSVFTYIMAIYIQNILDIFRYPPPTENKKRTPADEKWNLWRWALWALRAAPETSSPPALLPPPPPPPPPGPGSQNEARKMEEGLSGTKGSS